MRPHVLDPRPPQARNVDVLLRSLAPPAKGYITYYYYCYCFSYHYYYYHHHHHHYYYYYYY